MAESFTRTLNVVQQGSGGLGEKSALIGVSRRVLEEKLVDFVTGCRNLGLINKRSKMEGRRNTGLTCIFKDGKEHLVGN